MWAYALVYCESEPEEKGRSISESQTTEAVSSDPTEPVQESRSSAALSSLDLVPPITKDQQHTKILENHSTEPIIQSEQSHCNDLLNHKRIRTVFGSTGVIVENSVRITNDM
ncbi:hypothetical protein HCN44_006002 [Aphidius gifuensis]|uniref:Uncharacterized protein n=1 Tax=Aphidius gifuensis TaxID=684658 RepID=A0A834Y3N2_APHGI|nr:hypothetical protein HCN44_006002 [Aphidius gifuensis]